MQKITPFLWFENQAEEAVNFYVSVFKNAKLGQVARYPQGSPGGMAGKVMTASFQLEGTEFVALNGGPQYQMTPAISFVIPCEKQAEIDHYWEELSAGGKPQQCGWVTDRFGVTWQVVPSMLGKLLGGPDPARSQRVMQAMLPMQKIDIATLQRAAEGK